MCVGLSMGSIPYVFYRNMQELEAVRGSLVFGKKKLGFSSLITKKDSCQLWTNFKVMKNLQESGDES